MEETRRFKPVDERQSEVFNALSKVYDALGDKGYSPIDQIVGYLLSNDPTYITSYNGARSIMTKLDRDDVLHTIVSGFLGK